MKRKHPIIFSLIASLLLVTSFSGCSLPQSHGLDPHNPTRIVVWHYYNGSQAIAFDDLVMEFNNTIGAKKGIIVDSVSKSSVDDLIDSVTASAEKRPGAEKLPNIFQCYLDTAVSLDNMNILTDLDRYISEEEKSEYVDSYISEGTFGKEDAFKLFPIAKSTELLVINETAFAPFAKDAGVTDEDLSTWEGIAKTAEYYYKQTGGKSFFGRDSFANYMIVGSMQLGEEIFHVERGQVTANLEQSVMRTLWDNYYIPYIKGYYRHTGRFRTDDIKLGSIIAAVGSNTGMDYLPSEIPDENGIPQPVSYRILPVPAFEGTENYAVQQGASMAVTAASEPEEYASVEFLKWFTSEQNNIAFSISSGYLPVLKKSNDMNKIDAYLEENGLVLTSLEHDVLETSIEQVQGSQLYTSKGFPEGYAARNLLNTSMIELAVSDRLNIEEQIASGTSETDALSPYLEASYFEQWYQTLTDQMSEICTE